MKEYDILKELEKLDDDIEPGFLSELHQQAPDDLHSRIMNSIRQEALLQDNQSNIRELKPRNRFDYRKYLSVTAAAAMLFIAVVGGANSLLQNKVTPETISPKSELHASGQIEKHRVAEITPTTKENNSVVKNDNNNAANNPSEKKANMPGKKTAIDFNLAELKGEPAKKPKVSKELASASKDDPNVNPITIQPKKYQGSGDKTPVVSANPAGGPTSKGNQDPNAGQTTGDTNIGNQGTNVPPTSLDPKHPSIDPNTNLAYLDNMINYEISLNMSQIDIMQFIKEKGSKIVTDSVYKLSKDDFNTLSQMLEQDGITLDKVNDMTDTSVYIKIITY